MLDHPKHMIRDTARYSPFQRVDGRGKLKPRKLKALVAEHLKEEKWSGFQGSEVSGPSGKAGEIKPSPGKGSIDLVF